MNRQQNLFETDKQRGEMPNKQKDLHQRMVV